MAHVGASNAEESSNIRKVDGVGAAAAAAAAGVVRKVFEMSLAELLEDRAEPPAVSVVG